MKLKVAFVTALLAALATSAHADISFSLFDGTTGYTGTDLNSPLVVDANPAMFGGVIINNGPNAVELGDLSFTLHDGLASSMLTDIFGDLTLGDAPLTLGPGDSYTSNDLFEVTGLPSATGPFRGEVVLVTNDPLAPVETARHDFWVTGPNTNVPEPGALALFVGSMISGGLFVARRRRK